MEVRRKRGLYVPPLSLNAIELFAKTVRANLGFPTGRLDIVKCLEIEMPKLVPDFLIEPVSDSELGMDEARTYPNENRIVVRESVYEGACRGTGRDRFTLAHEFGHWGMHRNIGLPRSSNGQPIYCDAEWQADAFASALLMPKDEILAEDLDIFEIEVQYGVSFQAAAYRARKLNK